ncbi:MAG: hypothetical protein H6677_23765 [Candidatus Obscuribacterales bacterium]|nr:hypothetical protein [Candidatus Obscuribacterales bacterium]
MSELSEVQLTEFQAFRREFRHGVSYINARFDSVDVELHALRTDYSQIRTDVRALCSDVKALKADVKALRTDLHNAVQVIMGGLDRFYLQIQEDLRRIENKNS